MLQDYRQLNVVVSGDGRCNSQGKCAKFCTYTLMETNTNVILHSETMDKREVHNKSPNMEREVTNRGLAHLKGKVNIVEITTDPSTSVTKMLGLFLTCVNFCTYIYLNTADNHPEVDHSMDVWHKSKLLKKV